MLLFDDNSAYDAEAWKDPFNTPTRSRKVSCNLRLSYDTGDDLEEKSVRVREFDHSFQNGLLHADCDGLHSKETFYYDHIYSCVDLDSGEAITDIKNFLDRQYEQSSEKTIDILFYKYLDILNVLLFFSQLEDRFTDEELLIVSEYLKKLTGDNRLTTDQIESLFTEIISPSIYTIKKALVSSLAIQDVNKHELYTCCRNIVMASKKRHHQKQTKLDFIQYQEAELRAQKICC